MAEKSGVYVVPTMQMTQEDLHQLQSGTLPCQAVWKFRRDNETILNSQRLLARSEVKIAYGTDCGMFPFSHGIFEFQAMVKAGLSPVRALRAATSVAAELLGRNDLGVLGEDIFRQPTARMVELDIRELGSVGLGPMGGVDHQSASSHLSDVKATTKRRP